MKRVVVLGGGESGVGAAILAKKQGFDVFVSDFGQIKKYYQNKLNSYKILWEDEQHSVSEILNADVVVKSPGIPNTAAIVKKCYEKGVQIMSEIDFSLPYFNGELIGITGSNGKTTTTILTHYLLCEGGVNAGVGGNIGKSFAQQVAECDYDDYVLEISSFQLDDTEVFAPHIAVMTNLSPDHLDRYGNDESRYYDTKFKILQNQTDKDYFIFDGDDKNILEGIKKHKPKSKMLPFSVEKEFTGNGAYIKGEDIIINMNNEQFEIPVKQLAMKGKHNAKNAMAASLVSQLKRVRKESVRNSLSDFKGVEHRLEKVLKKGGVQYVNDSKATNVNATYFALESASNPLIWIVGGVDSGNDYSDLLPFVHEKVKAIVCLGIDNTKIKQNFERIVDVLVEVKSMEEAVAYSRSVAESGDTVLLSPACKSFDLFENYEDRGNQFKKYVLK